MLATGSSDKSIILWDLNNQRQFKTLNGHTSAVVSLISINEKYLLSGSCDHTLRLWSIANEIQAEIFKFNNFNSLPLSLDNLNEKTFICSSEDKTVRVFDINFS